MKKLYIYIIFLLMPALNLAGQITVSGSAGQDGNYTSLTEVTTGAFAAINGADQAGRDIVITILGDALSETGDVPLNSGNWTTFKIFPSGTPPLSLTISGTNNGPLISLNGADNVVIDGSLNETGSSSDLTIANASTGTSASTIMFINSAENNTVQYCTIKGSGTGTSRGIIYFATASAGNGNDGNTITNNNITNNNNNRPRRAVFSAGSTGFLNSGNIISGNNIYDFLKNGNASYGIFVSTSNSEWTITGNHFYETSTFVPTLNATHYIIRINSTTGSGFIVTDNHIGGSEPECGGTAWTKTSAFNNPLFCISLNSNTVSTNSIQNNTIRNFNWSNSLNANFTAIQVAGGNADIGTSAGNNIGAETGTSSIILANTTTATTTTGFFFGINVTGTGTANISNNKIGSITTSNAATNATNIILIRKSAVAGSLTVSNNIIGSTTEPASINASSESTGYVQNVLGIYNLGTGTILISGNTVANMTNSTTNTDVAIAGEINGISSTSGAVTVSGNTVHDLTNANANNLVNNNASVCGISLSGATLKTVSGNTVYNLSNTYGSFEGSVIGLYFAGSTGGNTISKNFIHSLSVSSGSTSGQIFGIRIGSGASTYSNNIISLGGDTPSNVTGIYETGGAGNNNNLYFNTIYIAGTVAGGLNTSFALYSNATTNARNFRNNMLVNARSTAGGTNLHFALYVVNTGGVITCNNNDYWVSGTGGTLGYYGAEKTTLPIVTGQDAGSFNIDPAFVNPEIITPVNYTPHTNAILAAAGTGITDDYFATTRSLTHPAIGAIEVTVIARIDVYKSAIFQAAYSSLNDAFNALNTGSLASGDFEIRINTSLTQTSSAVLNASGSGSASYDNVIVFPTLTGLTIEGNIAGPLINLNGADNVVIDGRMNATGTSADLNLINTSNSVTAGTSVIRFINDATSNTVRYCNIKGSPSGTTSGIVMFSTSTGTTGNDNNIVSNNNITSAQDEDRPVNAIYSAGTAALSNSENIISNNNIYNFLNRNAAVAYGVNLTTNNTVWTISGNSFFETAETFEPTLSSTLYFIRIITTTGNDFTVSGNYIGGTAALCSGPALTKTNDFDNVFFGIHISTATGTANNIHNNTIRNINWSNATTALFTGIQADEGDANIGTETGNNIGSTTGTGSITVTNTTAATLYGIYITTSGTIDCRNNNIGSITADNDAANRTNLYGIFKNGTAGTTTINNNTIGSTTTANSINSASTSTAAAQSVIGIYNGGNGTITITGNSIANLTNSSANTNTGTLGEINGISSIAGNNTISANRIFNLTNGNANTNATNNASVCGISVTAATLKTVTGNTIYNLSNTYSSFTGEVIGLYTTGSTGGNVISENFIHGLSVSGSSSNAAIYGIRIATGTSTYSNNIISLGGNTSTVLYGIYETGLAGNDNSLYFNTVYISGNPASGNYNSYALYNASNTNIRNFRNNLFINARSNNGATGKHYAIRIQGITNLTINYNDYYAPGTGGVLGFLTTDRTTLAAWQTATGQDLNSVSIDPLFNTAGGSAATDYIPEATLTGVDGTGITTDFGLVTRISPPTMGAWESSGNKWTGAQSTDWNLEDNWSKGTVPAPDANIEFDNNPDNDLVLDVDRSVNNIINATTYQIITGGNKLTLKGSLIFTGGAQIDASDASSTIEFAGTSSVAQTIPAGAFINNQVYNLTINNSDNVSLNGTLSLLNALTATSGRLEATTNTPTFSYAGSAAQTIEADQFLDERLWNLSIDNSEGVTLNTDFTVNNDLTINSGNLFTISAARLLTVTNTIINSAGNDGLVIKSDATGDAQLINNTSNVPATVELYLTGDLVTTDVGRFHYFVPPVDYIEIGETVEEVAAALDITDFAGDLLLFDESLAVDITEDGWVYFDNYSGTPSPGFTSIESTRGYNIYHRSSSDVLLFKGELNATDHSFDLTYTDENEGSGWNLIGNPFPCNYDLNGVEGLGTIIDGISNTVYYNNNGNYTYWNVFTNTGSTGGYTDILPPMTGFFVLLSPGGPETLIFPVESKTANTSDQRGLHKGAADPYSKGSEITKIKLVLAKGSKTDETIALLFDDATDSYNEHYDAVKRFAGGSASPDIYITKNDADYFMKAVKGPVTGTVTLPLKVVVRESGSHTITVTEFDNLNGLKVTLKHGTVETILSHGASYTFTSGTGTYSDFELVLGEEEITTGMETTLKSEFKTWYSNYAMNINSPDDIASGIGSIIIYDMQGKPVYNNRQIYLTPGETIQVPVNLKKGIYVVHIAAGGQPFISKIVVF